MELSNTITSRERAGALLIVLAFVVLLTGLSLAYFSRTTSDRQVAHSSFHQSKADQLAASAMDLVIGDLQREIANGSSPTPTATPITSPVPTPTASPFVYPLLAPSNILPVQWPTTPTIPNLVRRSMFSDLIPSPGVSSRASNVRSTQSAANQRFVSLPRWNKHYLIPRPGGALGTDTTPIADFTAPDWVILTRNGPAAFSVWNSTLADPSQSNDSYCVGRYAYAIYDEGGLVDANVAGFPSGTTAAQYGPKGASAFADLTVLGLLQSDIDVIVGWRNYFSAGLSSNFPNFNFNAAKATNYVNSVLSNTNGFMSVPVPSSTPNNMSITDQQFTTRQSLIQLLVNSGLSANAVNALQYLGTFSRELNAPSWAPTRNATDMGAPNNGTGNIYAYKNNAADPAATPINANLLNVRVANQFVRADGTCSCGGGPPPCDSQPCGAPLINRRFPLTRLAAIGPTGIVTTGSGGNALYSTVADGTPTVATAATVQRDFGLQWDNSNKRWNYIGGNGSVIQARIERLDEVAGENREPNFFELLKAVILNGSVGMGSGSGNTFVAAEPKYYDNTGTNGPTSSDYQIMQIGGNVISQWDSSNTPVFIGFGTDPSTSQPYELAGIKNLPYLSKIVFKPYWKKQSGTPTFEAWLLPSLWNPHQNAPTPASQKIRLQMTLGTGTTATATCTSPNMTSPITSTQYMTFDSSANTFNTPSAPTTIVSSLSSSGVTQSPDTPNYWGFDFAQVTLPNDPNSSSTAYPDFGTNCTFELQVQVSGTWKSYQKWTGCTRPTSMIYSKSSSPQNDKTIQDPEFVTLDPRTVRFGVWGNDAHDSGNSTDYTVGVLNSLDESVGSPPSTGAYEVIPAALTTLRPNGSMFASATSPNLYLYANNTDNTVYYNDLDSVKRQGDAITPGYATAMQPTDSADRPLALNGAFLNGVFQSVADLGHVFRDQPWKTLKFTSASSDPSYPMKSPDDGLLDVFTLHESSIDAGKTSLNTRQAPVLKAILSKAALNLKGTSIITATQIDDGNGHGVIPALTSLTSSQPMLNKAELVTRLASNSYVTALGNKEARECVLRAFSDAGQTRTWNLLIDLIAQSGRYPPNASSLTGFVVEGETHYWIHVAIDRFTGQVIDKQIEVVNE